MSAHSPASKQSSIYTQRFDDQYAQLNAVQKQVVDAIEGPVLLLAGPGTGKTHVLSMRIAAILRNTDTPPNAILALTFTQAAAAHMRQKLVKLIGPEGYYVRMMTFHAYCSGLISEFPEYFTHIDRNSQPLSAIEAYAILEDILQKSALKELRPINTPCFYARDILKAISQLKRENVGPERYEQLMSDQIRTLESQQSTRTEKQYAVAQKALAKQVELGQVYQAYQQALAQRARYDFDDMIVFAARALENNEELLLQQQERAQYILVDEYQDTNSAQNALVDLLTSYWGERANIFAVGDPHQSIYRFQGASMENMLGFTKRYPEALVANLREGYRCVQPIYDAAHRLIAHNQLESDFSAALGEPLESKRDLPTADLVAASAPTVGVPTTSPLTIEEAPSQVVELIGVAKHIQAYLQAGVLPEEIAVLYRTNREATQIQEVLERFGIHCELEGGESVLDSQHIQQLLNLLGVVRTIASGAEPDDLFALLCYEWSCVPADVALQLARAASTARMSIYALLQHDYAFFMTQLAYSTVTAEQYQQASEFIGLISRFATKEPAQLLSEWFVFVLEESGYLGWIIKQPIKAELLVQLNSLYQELVALVATNRTARLTDFLDRLALMREYSLSIQAEDWNVSAGAVSVSTAHKAKGREWQYVFIIGCIDGRWGNRKKMRGLVLPDGVLEHTAAPSELSAQERNQEERRLLYVALTRGIERVHVSYALSQVDQSGSKPTSASMFVAELGAQPEQVGIVPEEATEYMQKMLQPTDAIQLGDQSKVFFEKLIQNFALSATGLNAYLRDPWKFVVNTLLRVPSAQPGYMAYGTAAHSALEFAYRQLRDAGALPEIAATQQVYVRALEREPLSELELELRSAQGKKMLEQYYDGALGNEPTGGKSSIEGLVHPLFLERAFGSKGNWVYLDEIPLTGKVDRIDYIDASHARVVDYKTGAHKTDGDLQATTKTMQSELSERERALHPSIRSPHKRQLLFYALLAECDASFKPNISEAVFEFLPNKKQQKIVRRTIQISETELAELKKLIAVVYSEIVNLEFLP